MKKILVLLIVSLSALRAFSQCSPDSTITEVGFYPMDSLLPCLEADIYYDETLLFTNFSRVKLAAFPDTFDIVSVQIDTVRNLPAGITYDCNTPNCFYTTGESGCVRISGTTTAAPGVYNLGFNATAKVSIGGSAPFTYQLDSLFLATYGLGYSLVVVAPGDSCPNHHTGQLFFNASVIDPSYCNGDTVPFHTLTSGGTPPYSYAWHPDDNLSDADGSSPLLYPTNPGVYTVTVTDHSGLSAADTLEVIYSSPAISLTEDTTICPGDSILLEASGGESYNWLPATGLSAADTSSPFASPAQSTTYVVEVSNNTCSVAGSVTVSVESDDVQAVFTTITIENDLNVAFNNTSTGATAYQWDFGDGSTSTEEDPQYQYPENAEYTVTLIASNRCGYADTVVQVVDLSTGIGTIYDNRMIKVYPNPGTGRFLLKAEAIKETRICYEIFSAHGEMVKSETLKAQGDLHMNLDLADQVSGVYFLKVRTSNYSAFAKIILQ